MIHRVSYIFAIFLSFLLLSCSAEREEPTSIYDRGGADNPSWRMAGARSINPKMLDDNLSNLISETHVIEGQIDKLLGKLKDLRTQIAIHQELSTAEQPVTMVAKEEPKVILPVPERPKAVVKKSVKPKSKPVAKKSMKTAGVVGVRTGVHKRKTRLVFDVNGSTAHKVDFDKELGVLTVSLSKTKWATQTGKTYKLSQLAGYQAKNSGQGSIIALSVKKTSSIKTSVIGKSGAKPARLIVDLIQ